MGRIDVVTWYATQARRAQDEEAMTHEYATMREAAEAAVRAGTCPAVFDYAIPQNWADDVLRVTGTYPRGIVWGYPDRSIWGMPYPVTPDGRAILARYARALAGDETAEDAQDRETAENERAERIRHEQAAFERELRRERDRDEGIVWDDDR